MHADRAEFDVPGGDPLAVRVVSIIQGYPLREFIKRRISKRFSAKFDPEDVMQDVMLSIVSKSEPEDVFRMHNAGELRAWLITVIRRNVADVVRMLRTKKRASGLNTYGETEIQDRFGPWTFDAVYDEQARSPSNAEAVIEANHAVRAALYSLPVHHRRAVALFYLEGFPRSEVARILDKSLGSVHGLLRRGIRMLRRKMGPADQWFSKAESGDYLWKMLGESEDPTDDDNT